MPLQAAFATYKVATFAPDFMKPVSEIYARLSSSNKIVVTMHQKPDGDAMGSALALYHFLKALKQDVQVISPTNWADNLTWMPGAETVMDYENKTAAAQEKLRNADVIFCLDFNTLSRTKNMEPALESATGARVLIDHHQQPQEDKFEYGISNTAKSSTCEMVYDFINDGPYADLMNTDIATCLYTGVMTDTGSFRFPSTTASVHKMIAALKENGLQHSLVHESIFDSSTENVLRFIGNTLLNRLEIFYEYNTALITIPFADLQKFDIRTGDTEGLVNYPFSIKGIRLAVIIIDRGDVRKCSFRSKGDFDVNTFARIYFNGGGHRNAAGGQSEKPLAEVRQDFLNAVKANSEQLAEFYAINN